MPRIYDESGSSDVKSRQVKPKFSKAAGEKVLWSLKLKEIGQSHTSKLLFAQVVQCYWLIRKRIDTVETNTEAITEKKMPVALL